jgi:hypothetical protein
VNRPGLLLVVLLLGACGGSAVPAGRTPADSDRSEPEQAPPAMPGYGAQPSQQPGVPTPAGPSDGPFAEEPPMTLSEALEGFEQASTELSSAGLRCESACKAFASMQRASERICALNGADDPGSRCRKAKQRLDEARETLRRRCGSCDP